MLDFLQENRSRLLSGEFIRNGGIVYFIWGANLGCRTISCVGETEFDELDTISLMSATKNIARINYTGNIIAI